MPRIVARRRATDPNPIPVPSCDRAEGACLLLDIRGFTPLTERLARRGVAGAEEMMAILNRVFEPIIEAAATHGGEIIDFAGDALLIVWWAQPDLGEAVMRAAQFGLEVQDHMGAWPPPEEPISLKLVITAGGLQILHLGRVDGRKRCLVTGPPVEALEPIEQRAEAGDVLVSAEASALLEDGVSDRLEGGHLRLTSLGRTVPRRSAPPLVVPADAEEALREYVQPAVTSRLDADRDEWLAEFRRCSTVFVNLIGFRFGDDTAVGLLHEVTLAIQQIVHHTGVRFTSSCVETRAPCCWPHSAWHPGLTRTTRPGR